MSLSSEHECFVLADTIKNVFDWWIQLFLFMSFASLNYSKVVSLQNIQNNEGKKQMNKNKLKKKNYWNLSIEILSYMFSWVFDVSSRLSQRRAVLTNVMHCIVRCLIILTFCDKRYAGSWNAISFHIILIKNEHIYIFWVCIFNKHELFKKKNKQPDFSIFLPVFLFSYVFCCIHIHKMDAFKVLPDSNYPFRFECTRYKKLNSNTKYDEWE